VAGDDLDVDSVRNDLAFLLELVVLWLGELGEAELDAAGDGLAAGELELASSEGLLGVGDVGLAAPDRHEDGSDVYSCGSAVGLSVGLSHALLESISSSAREHFVDSDDVPRVDSDSHVEGVLAGLVGHVLVGGNAGRFEGLGGDLFLLSGDQVDAVGELVVDGLLLADVVNSELRVGHSSVVTRLWKRLVLLISIAARWSSSHFYIK